MRPPSLTLSPTNGSWPFESPMDPQLNDGILGNTQVQEEPKSRSASMDDNRQILAPESPKLERLSNAVYDPKRPFSSTTVASRSENRQTAHTSTGSDFGGFNFGTAFTAHLNQIDSQPPSRKQRPIMTPTLGPTLDASHCSALNYHNY